MKTPEALQSEPHTDTAGLRSEITELESLVQSFNFDKLIPAFDHLEDTCYQAIRSNRLDACDAFVMLGDCAGRVATAARQSAASTVEARFSDRQAIYTKLFELFSPKDRLAT